MLLFMSPATYYTAPSIAEIDEETDVLQGADVKVYANENERLTHFTIKHGKRESSGLGNGGEWANITVAVNAETFSANYYGSAESDRVERSVETEWLPADTVQQSIVEQGVTHGMALALAVRRVQYQGHAPTVFTWRSDFRERTMRVGAVLSARFSEWQDAHGEAKPVMVRIIKSEDSGDGVLKLEAQALGIYKRRGATGTMDPRAFAFIAPDHVGATFDTASAADRAYNYLADGSAYVGAGNAPGYLIP